jgi:photosystem II stability/assembly factor-like uncharacterized protein
MNDGSMDGERLLQAWREATSRVVPPAALDELVNAELRPEEIRVQAATASSPAVRREGGVRGGPPSALRLAAVVSGLLLVSSLAAWGAWLTRSNAPGRSAGASEALITMPPTRVSVVPKRIDNLPGTDVLDFERTSATVGWAVFRSEAGGRLAITSDAGRTWFDVTPQWQGVTTTIAAADGRGSDLWFVSASDRVTGPVTITSVPVGELTVETAPGDTSTAEPTEVGTLDATTYQYVGVLPMVWLWRSTDAGRTWEMIELGTGDSTIVSQGDEYFVYDMNGDPPALRTNEILAGVSFGSASAGLVWTEPSAAGICPVESTTPDGGVTWCTMSRPGRVFATDDGGWTWSSLGEPPDSFTSVAMLDSQSGYATGISGVFRTSNGGRSWRPIQLPAPAQGIRVVADGAFADDDHGMALSYDQTPSETSVDPSGEQYIAIDNSTAWTLWVTADGGATWRQAADVPWNSRPLAADATRWFVLEPDGHLRRSEDGGTSWTRSGTAALPEGAQLSFADATHGWGLVEEGYGSVQYGPGLAIPRWSALYATDDGGFTWTRVETFPITGWTKAP